MREVSTVIAASYGNRYLPMIKKLGNHICYCYGVGFPRKYTFTDEPMDKMKLTKVSSRISSRIVKPLAKLLKLPDYYAYYSNIVIFDWLMSRKVAKDSSRIVFANPLLCRVVEKCKKKGKIVICEAGNSEPNREYERVSKEYEEFKIKHKYIYGDKRFRKRVNKSFSLSDYIVTISEIANKTYIEAGYDVQKLKLISMAGTDFPIRRSYVNAERPKAFISLAFQSFLKGTHRLLLAWKKANIKNIPLVIAGRLSDDVKEFIDRYGPFENVVYPGYLSDLTEFYESYDAVGVLLSLSEGAVRVTPEMMSFGYPMITSPDASCDIVVDGVNGFIVPSLDEECIAQRLRWFAEDWSRVHNLRESVINSVSHRTVKEYSEELGDYIMSLI